MTKNVTVQKIINILLQRIKISNSTVESMLCQLASLQIHHIKHHTPYLGYSGSRNRIQSSSEPNPTEPEW